MESDQSYHIGIETGGTTCKVGVVQGANSFNIIEKTEIQTRAPKETTKDIIDYINSLPYTYSSVGIAAFGPICLDKTSPEYGNVTTTPKEGWKDFPLRTTIVEGIKNQTQDMKVAFETDVNAVALFEFLQGGHENVRESLAYITVGTGIGLGLIVNGKTVHGLVHPEGGHIRVPILKEHQDFQGVCSYHKDCLEGFCTNVSIAKQLGLKSVDELPNIGADHEIWDKVGYYLGTCCANLTLTMSVERIVIGGGVMNQDVLYDKIRKHFSDTINGYIDNPALKGDALKNYIVRSKFEKDLGILAASTIGAASQETK